MAKKSSFICISSVMPFHKVPEYTIWLKIFTKAERLQNIDIFLQGEYY